MYEPIDLRNQMRLRETSKLHKVDIDGRDLPKVLKVRSRYLKNTYLVDSPSAFRILTQPWLVGGSLANAARKCSTELLEVAYKLAPEFRSVSYDSVAEVIPLAGALYYQIGAAFQILFNESLNQCFIGAKRILDSETKTWKTSLSYLNFEAMPPSPLIIIGDTIATGGTIEQIITQTSEAADQPRAMILFSIAGSALGAYKLSQLASRFEFPCYIFFTCALFGVADNGTDMPWLHPATITTNENRMEILDTFGEQLGQEWCSVWDWGERAKYPQKHISELLKRTERYLVDGEHKESEIVLKRIEKQIETAQVRRADPLKILTNDR